MKRKRIIIIVSVVIVAVVVCIFIYLNKKKYNASINEIEPEEEISLSQERKTMVSLYFKNKTTNNIEPEGRLVDVKDLVDNPYVTILNLLITGAQNEALEKTIPEGTIVNSAKIEGDILKIDLSQEFIDNQTEGEEQEMYTIKSIVNSLTELSEVNSVKILINGEENKEYKDGKVTFTKEFYRENEWQDNYLKNE